jgi:hypothetical protein
MFYAQEVQSDSDEMALLDDLSKDLKELSKSHQKLGLKVASIEGQLAAPKKAHNPYLVAVVAGCCTAFVVFLGWMAVTLVHLGTTLASIQQLLLSMGVKLAANNPADPEAQADAVATLERARKDSTFIPVPTIQEAGTRFIDAAQTAPKAWDVALKFVSYRTTLLQSVLLADTAQHLATTPANPALFSRYVWNDVPGRQLPRFTVGGDVPFDQSATAHPLSSPNLDAGRDRGKEVILGIGGSVAIDNTLMKHVVLRNVAVFYSGGPVVLDDVTFVDCTFVLMNVEAARNFALSVLASTKISFSA